MPRPVPFLPLVALAAALLALGACGRRGGLEPSGGAAVAPAPRGATAQAAEAAQATGPLAGAPDDEEEGVAPVAPTPAPGARRRKGYAVPPGPFLLDPIL